MGGRTIWTLTPKFPKLLLGTGGRQRLCMAVAFPDCLSVAGGVW